MVFKFRLIKSRTGTSNLERISVLAPDILKVDLTNLRQTALLQSYQDILYSLSLLARRIGATLLYEEIDAFINCNMLGRTAEDIIKVII